MTASTDRHVTDPVDRSTSAVTPGRGERVAWFQCAAGTAGDMTLGALVDAGADPLEVGSVLQELGLDGWALTFEHTQRCGLAASRAIVLVHGVHEEPRHSDPGHVYEPVPVHHHEPERSHDHSHDQVDPAEHRPYRAIRALIERADLPERVRERSLRVFRALAEVEGEMHGVEPADVELHEVGSLDAIIDVVGSCAALESLGIDRVECSTIGVGHGTVRAAHGTLPNPAPAVIALLERAQAPARGIDDHREIATPTGVALMTALAESFGPMPAMTVTASGFGAGTSDIPGRPNVVQVVIGEGRATTVTPDRGTASQLFEVNVDDATGEVLAHTVAALLAAGAQDAWITPIVMKKGRPAHTVHVLCDPAAADAVAAVLVAETGTLGLRASTVQRWPQARTEHTVDVDGQAVRVKLAAGRVKVEHDDAVAAAAALRLPLRTVLARAESLATDLH